MGRYEMKSKSSGSSGFVRDPYKGDSFVMAHTRCTPERRSFFKRANEIIGFLRIGEYALQQCGGFLQQQVSKHALQPDTPLRIKAPDGQSVIMPVSNAVRSCGEGVDILARQIFVMLYGSFETFLFQICERAFNDLGIQDEVLNKSLDILQKKKWDGKFCGMRDTFGVDYKSSHLIDHFSGFKMKFGDQEYRDPLQFLDELSQVRHRIVHASSLLHGTQILSIQTNIFLATYVFYARLTDYIDDLFAKKFGYERQMVDPAKA